MKKSLITFLLVAVLGSGCDVVKVRQPEEPRIERTETFNLDFEEGDPGDRVPGWWENIRGQYRIELVDDVKKSGAKSSRIRALSGENTDASLNQTYVGAIAAGKTVRVKAWIKVEDTEICKECNKPGLDESSLPEDPRRGAQIRVIGDSPTVIVTETLVTPLVMGNHNWVRFEAFAAMPSDTSSVIIAPILWGKGKAWFDDIEVIVE